MSYHIRQASVSDVDILGKIHSQSLQTAFKGIIPDSVLNGYFSAEKRTDSFRRELCKNIPETVLIFDGDIPAGLMSFGECRDEKLESHCIEIWRIYLLPSFMGKGIGKELMNWCICELRKRGYKKIVLWVLEENTIARRFYEKVGFKDDGTVKSIHLGKDLNERRYRMILS